MKTLVPYGVLWGSLLLNVILFAIALGLVHTMVDTTLRAIRVCRNLCPHCAYPVGTSTICTECGKPVKPRSAVPA